MEATTAQIESSATTLRERRQQRTREELVDAVLSVIANGGLADATIDRVTAVSGISRGTVYAHFPGGRDELLRAAYATLGHDLVARTRAAVTAAEGWRAQLAAHAQALFDLAQDSNTGHFFNVSGPTLIVEGAERGIGSGASLVMIRETLEQAQSEGQVDPTFDVDAVAALLVGSIREAAIGVAAGVREADTVYAAFVRLIDGLAVAEPNATL